MKPGPWIPSTFAVCALLSGGHASGAPAPFTGPAVAYLKASGEATCAWMRQPLPTGPATPVFTFDAACAQSVFAWSPDGKQGVVLDWPLGGGQQRLWAVDFATKSGKAVDLKGLPAGTGKPEGFMIFQVNFNAAGQWVALLMDSAHPPEDDTGPLGITFEGKRYPVAEAERWRRMCLAYLWDGTTWKRVEQKLLGSPLELSARRSLYDPTPERTETVVGAPASKAQAQRLTAARKPTDRYGKWMALPTPGGPLLYRARQEDKDGTPTASTPVRWEQDNTLVAPEGLTPPPDTDISVLLSDTYLILNVSGEPNTAAVFDTRTKKNLHTLQAPGDRALFWPAPAMSSETPDPDEEPLP
ncbi:hypothetical protein [Melittangium boletus]|uniref:hypothetical protein n=1 Tax=Melittangium boletus TaxID=83453 RepID=UPI003DA252A0